MITDKSQYKHLKVECIEAVVTVIKDIIDSGHSVIVIHGAGSFGHIESRKWGLADGCNPDIEAEQDEAVTKVRSDMLELNRHVISAFEAQGIDAESLPPRNWAKGVGISFRGDLTAFVRGPSDAIPITFGDVVDIPGELKFGILSGDHIMVRMGIELPDVTACLFLLGDADGLMDGPPWEPGATLIEQWIAADAIRASHDSDTDVTGGILLKAECASMIASSVEQVWLLNGHKPKRMLEVVLEGETVTIRRRDGLTLHVSRKGDKP